MTPEEIRQLRAEGIGGEELVARLVATGDFSDVSAREFIQFVLHGGDIQPPLPGEQPRPLKQRV